MRASALALLSLLPLAACANFPSEQSLLQADYGAEPNGSHQDEIRAAFTDLLIDPGSARCEYGEPEPGWGTGEGGFVYGWVVWTRVNSKNQFGAFTGWKTYKVLTVDGKVHSIYRPLESDLFGNPRFQRLR